MNQLDQKYVIQTLLMQHKPGDNNLKDFPVCQKSVQTFFLFQFIQFTQFRR